MGKQKNIFMRFFVIFFIVIFAIAYFVEQKDNQIVDMSFIFPFSLILASIGSVIAWIAIPIARDESNDPSVNNPTNIIEKCIIAGAWIAACGFIISFILIGLNYFFKPSFLPYILKPIGIITVLSGMFSVFGLWLYSLSKKFTGDNKKI